MITIVFWIYWVKYNILLKSVSPVTFVLWLLCNSTMEHFKLCMWLALYSFW